MEARLREQADYLSPSGDSFCGIRAIVSATSARHPATNSHNAKTARIAACECTPVCVSLSRQVAPPWAFRQ